MPKRISIAGAIVLAACLVVPVSVSAVSSASAPQRGATAEDADPPEPYPSTMPMTAAPLSADGAIVMGKATINAAGYAPDSFSWPILLGLIVVGFLPSVMIILRSSHRRRAGPIEPIG